MTNFIPIDTIIIADRQRTEIGNKKLEELKASILSKGLLHAPVVSREEDGSIHLRAGERRLRAMAALHAEGHTFFYNGAKVPTDQIPTTYTSELSRADLFELELEENLCREDISWKDQVMARDKLHAMRKAENPQQTISATAAEVAEMRDTSLQQERTLLSNALLLAKHMDNPRVQRAKTERQAIKELLDENEKRFKAKLIQAEKKIDSPHAIIHADCREAFAKIQKGSINTIIADPPYGISANQSGQESKHFYDDSEDYALDICKFIIREGFHLCTPRAIMFMFCDIDHFVTLKTYAAQHAWSVYRTPLIWNKMAGTRAPWGRAGFQRSYELILFAVKGQDELVHPGGPDILNFKQAHHSERSHAASKPKALLSHLVRLSTLPGETILDPCCGSGSIIPAADEHKVRTICIEQDETYYATALARLDTDSELEDEETDDDLSDLLPSID